MLHTLLTTPIPFGLVVAAVLFGFAVLCLIIGSRKILSATRLSCRDCDLPYAEFPLDVVLPDDQWLLIHPEGSGGVLCAQCIVQRAAKIPGVTHMIAMFSEPELRRSAEDLRNEIDQRLYIGPPCKDGHVWSNQFGDDWTPDVGARCDCGERRWQVSRPSTS